MHNMLLFNKISNQLFEICKENEISKITYLVIDVNYNSHINKKNLLEYLLEEIPELVNIDTSVKITRSNTDPLIAVIKKLEGMDEKRKIL